MKLFMSHTSPFARKVRMFLRVSGLLEHTEEVATTFESDDLRQLNPLGKIPALVDAELTLFDSPLICEYLDEQYVEAGNYSLFNCDKENYFDVQSTHALTDGITDAAVLTVMELKRSTEKSPYWLDRWQKAMETGIRHIDLSAIGSQDELNIATLSTAACLGYLDFRLPDLGWRDWNPELATWFTSITEQAWYLETAPPQDA